MRYNTSVVAWSWTGMMIFLAAGWFLNRLHVEETGVPRHFDATAPMIAGLVTGLLVGCFIQERYKS